MVIVKSWQSRVFIVVLVSSLLGLVGGHSATKKALIFGVSGQDGTYLKEFLIGKGYEVHGVTRKTAFSSPGVKNNEPNFFLHSGDVLNALSVYMLIQSIQPDEIYHLAAQSSVKDSFDYPKETAEVNALGTLQILETMRLLKGEKKIKFFHAASSELFGVAKESPQSETTPFQPRSPYGVTKLFAHWLTVNYRESYGLFACNGILFNHESPLRGEMFVTRKIILAACRYKLGLQDCLYLGNLEVKRDWGFAKDYVEAMWLILQHDKPEDFVIATGESHSVRQLVETAFKELGIEIEWHGKGVDEYGIDKQTGNTIVRIDPSFYRPAEVDNILGNPEKAAKLLHWIPSTKFDQLVKIMVEADFARESLKKSVK